jgi:hypothetical protein
MRFLIAPRVSPSPRTRGSSVKEPGAAPAPGSLISTMVASLDGRIDGTFGGSFRFDDYERAGDHKTDRAVYFRAVSDDADAQRDQLLETLQTTVVRS